jgi:hypothetical protein
LTARKRKRNGAGAADTVKLVAAILIAVAGLVAFYYFQAPVADLACAGSRCLARSSWAGMFATTSTSGAQPARSSCSNRASSCARSSGRRARRPADHARRVRLRGGDHHLFFLGLIDLMLLAS